MRLVFPNQQTGVGLLISGCPVFILLILGQSTKYHYTNLGHRCRVVKHIISHKDVDFEG